MKEQSKNPPDQTNEEEIGSLPEKEFRVVIVKMIQNLGNRIDKMQETFNKDVEELKRNQAMMKNTINEIKNTIKRPQAFITGHLLSTVHRGKKYSSWNQDACNWAEE